MEYVLSHHTEHLTFPLMIIISKLRGFSRQHSVLGSSENSCFVIFHEIQTCISEKDQVKTQKETEQNEDNLETSDILLSMENSSNENQEEEHPKEEESLENSFISEKNTNYNKDEGQVCDNMDNLINNNDLNANDINNEKSNFIRNTIFFKYKQIPNKLVNQHRENR